ncbi:MAG: hypothetical protein ACE5HP_10340 [Gemmatimonadota bacterium]
MSISRAGAPMNRRSPERRGAAAPAAVAALAAFLFLPVPAAAQEMQFESPDAATLRPTASEEAAVRHFWMALDDAENIFPARAVKHIEQALEIDPGFGLARALHGFSAPGLSAEERQKEIRAGLAAMSEATAAEILLATAWREWRAGNTRVAKKIVATASALAPSDPHLAYAHAQLVGAVAGGEKGLEATREVTTKFPDFAPAWNILAYQLWAADDHEGAFQAVRKYEELVPDHPNSHDSHAELLQWDGKLEEAAAHYERAIELSPDYNVGYVGLAEVRWLQGATKEIYPLLEQAAAHAPTDAGRVNARRALAGTYLMTGDRKRAVVELATVATEAETAGLTALAALAHQQMAVIDALGNGKRMEAHLARAAELSGAENPGQQAWTALAYATAGRTAEAQSALEALDKTVGSDGNPGLRSTMREVKAILLLRQNQATEAMAELEESTADRPLTRALKAECYKKLKDRTKASEMKMDLVSDPTLNFYNAILPFALIRVQKV